MPKVIFTVAVKDRAHWASKRSERVAAFAAWGSNVVDYFNADGTNNVAVSVDVHDFAAMEQAIASPEIAAAKQAHGLIEPVMMFVENS